MTLSVGSDFGWTTPGSRSGSVTSDPSGCGGMAPRPSITIGLGSAAGPSGTTCPHCDEVDSVPPKPAHMCGDTLPWSRAEKDAKRAQVRERYPWMQFTRANPWMGEKGRRD